MSQPSLIHYTQSLLLQLKQLVEALSVNEYGEALALLNSVSIGQHVRHIVELFEELHNGYDCGKVNYDQRKRNKLLETDQQAAVLQLVLINENIIKADKNLAVAVSLGSDAATPFYVESNYQRELLYNVEHMVHHMAIIRIAVENCTSKKVSATFGVADATIRHQQLCAQ